MFTLLTTLNMWHSTYTAAEITLTRQSHGFNRASVSLHGAVYTPQSFLVRALSAILLIKGEVGVVHCDSTDNEWESDLLEMGATGCRRSFLCLAAGGNKLVQVNETGCICSSLLQYLCVATTHEAFQRGETCS